MTSDSGLTSYSSSRTKGETNIFDQTIRSVWLREQLWPALRDKFPVIASLPLEALITVGYPSSGARGRSEKIRPAEVNTQWTGNANEQVFISIHPVYFTSADNVAKALLFQTAKRCCGARWGASRVGLTKHDDGTITANANTQATINSILADIGDPPSGFGHAFPVREVSRARLRRYLNNTPYCTNGDKHPVIRAASDLLNVKCDTCGSHYVAA